MPFAVVAGERLQDALDEYRLMVRGTVLVTQQGLTDVRNKCEDGPEVAMPLRREPLDELQGHVGGRPEIGIGRRDMGFEDLEAMAQPARPLVGHHREVFASNGNEAPVSQKQLDDRQRIALRSKRTVVSRGHEKRLRPYARNLEHRSQRTKACIDGKQCGVLLGGK